MNVDEYINDINRYFVGHSISIDKSAFNAFLNPKYFNKEWLEELPDETLRHNLEMIYLDVLENFHIRRRTRSRAYPRHILTARDVYPVLRKRFCKLPPFCRYEARKIGF
jgi:hypothetical protein